MLFPKKGQPRYLALHWMGGFLFFASFFFFFLSSGLSYFSILANALYKICTVSSTMFFFLLSVSLSAWFSFLFFFGSPC